MKQSIIKAIGRMKTGTCYNRNRSCKHFAKKKKPVPKHQRVYDPMFVACPESTNQLTESSFTLDRQESFGENTSLSHLPDPNVFILKW